MPDLLWADGSISELDLETVTILGSGRAAEVRLVRDTVSGQVYAEKAFKRNNGLSRLGRDILYRACFQAPHPYGTRTSALRAALQRRKVHRDLTQFWFGAPLIADGLYTRWDTDQGCLMLGTEYIAGRGPRPGELDPHRFRKIVNSLTTRIRHPRARSPRSHGKSPPWEIDEATAVLDRLRARFNEAGFVGSQWQVDKTLSVPTSNLRRDRAGRWMLVDVESAFPALLLPRYIRQGFGLGAFPLFDDVDFPKLRRYLRKNQVQLQARLSEEQVHRLYRSIDLLQQHTEEWKESEPALFTHRHRLFLDRALWRAVRSGYVEHWHIGGRVPAEKAEQLRSSWFRFVLYLGFDSCRSLLAGLFAAGKGMYPLIVAILRAIGITLRLLYSAVFDEAYLRRFAESRVSERIKAWEKLERLTPQESDQLRQCLDSPAVGEYLKGFVVHLGLQLIEPPFIGTSVYALLAILLEEPELLSLIFLSPAMRTSYTVYRMVRNRDKRIKYYTALLWGAIPVVGILAYPLQMSTAHPDLSAFLARWQLSHFSSRLVLFGGTDSRVEHFSIKVADTASSIHYEVIDLPHTVTSLLRSMTGRKHDRAGVRERESAKAFAQHEQHNTCGKEHESEAEDEE